MERKVINDAVAYIRGLAELRGRNKDWAEQTVREASNLPASEALAAHVIDLIAADLDDLLRQIDGREVALDGGTVKLDLNKARSHARQARLALSAVVGDHRSERRVHPADDRHLRFDPRVLSPGHGRSGRHRRHLPAAGRIRAADVAGQLRRACTDRGRHRSDGRGDVPAGLRRARCRGRCFVRIRFGDTDGHRPARVSDFDADHRRLCRLVSRHLRVRHRRRDAYAPQKGRHRPGVDRRRHAQW